MMGNPQVLAGVKIKKIYYMFNADEKDFLS